MTAHQKLIQRHSPKWDQTDMPVFHLKAPDMFPEFRMDIKIQRDIFLFQKSLKPLILQKCFITLIVFTFFELILADILQPASPCRHQQDLFMSRIRLVLQHIPSGQSGDNDLFIIVSEIIMDDLLFITRRHHKQCHLIASAFMKGPVALLEAHHSMLEKYDVLPCLIQNLVDAVGRIPDIKMPDCIGRYQIPCSAEIDHVLK